MTRILSLGVHNVRFGFRNDPNRLTSIVPFEMFAMGNRLDDSLDSDRFADKGESIRGGKGIADWPEGAVDDHELLAVCFEKELSDTAALLVEANAFIADKPDLHKAIFPHLATQLTFKKLGLLREEKNISCLALADESSLWRFDDGRLCTVYASCEPPLRDLSPVSIKREWASNIFFFFTSNTKFPPASTKARNSKK